MQLPNPNDGRPFDRVMKDANGEAVYGVRGEHTPSEEIIHIPTNHSNTHYWQPEMVMNPEGCPHVFHIYDVGKREIECDNCHYATTFHAGINYHEEDGKCFVTIKGTTYPLTP